MNLSLKTPLLMLLSYFVAFLFFSCSRDSDLFDDYVLGDSSEDEIGAFDPDSNNQGSSGTETNTVNDTFEVVLSNSTVLDVLANDSFKSLEIAITETSEPSFGSVEINKDNTLTYTPNEGGIVEILNTSSNPPSELMDEFTYTAESKFDGIVENTSVGTVRVRILLPPREQGSPSANLLFGSGFEGSTTVNANGAVGAPNDYQYITGTDSSTGFTWSSNLIPSWRDSGSGIHTIYGGSNPQDIIRNELVTISGPDGNPTTALRQTKNRAEGASYGGPGSQTPYQINNIQNDPSETYFTWWHRYDDLASLTNGDGNWRMLWQYKTQLWDQPSGFRTSIFLQSDSSGRLYWRTIGDTKLPQSSNTVWAENSTAQVPKEQWFKVEIYVKWSSGSDGRFWAKINGVEIANHNGPNIGPRPDSLRWIGIWQFYGPGNGQQWIDDYQIWDGVPF